ncbi:MAG: ATP-binding protein [Acidobacteria bacterium]|nr:ATP-binding protein [Acidobacteriota bacterium]MCG3193833.1 Anti-sigma F factor [Thermoanaerobaculia bacterium]MCK6680912.1 ATP-binding protein [Thermoanaerobaculia bacterium]
MTESSRSPVVLWLSSRYENIELAMAALEEVSRNSGIENDMEHWIGMALREAVANAIKHGNRQDPEKRVMVSFDVKGDDITIRVGDEGPGFDSGSVADPLAPENQLRPSGRGIFYMKTFMDLVTFQNGDGGGGTIVTMTKNFKNKKP